MNNNDNHFIHSAAIVELGAKIGDRTRVWAFSHILPGAIVGSDCNICDHVFIENDVLVGDRVTIKCGVQLWDGLRVGDDVFIGPNVTFTNDRFPRSRQRPSEFKQTHINNRASIGANATILPGLTIGEGAMVGAGSVVTRSIPANAIVVGNPARITGYVDAGHQEKSPLEAARDSENSQISRVGGVSLIALPCHKDMRGELSVGTFASDFPFLPQRFFIVYNVPSREVRGQHAHHLCHQFLICTQGSIRVLADDGKVRQEFLLNRPDIGLYLPPMIWAEQFSYSADASLLVFASHNYDPQDYIRDYTIFTTTAGSKQ